MSPKKRQNDSGTPKRIKKEKRGELAVINSDMRDEAIQKGMRDAWQRKDSFSNGAYAYTRDSVLLWQSMLTMNMTFFSVQAMCSWTVHPSLIVRSPISYRVKALWKVYRQNYCNSISTASPMTCISFNRYQSAFKNVSWERFDCWITEFCFFPQSDDLRERIDHHISQIRCVHV